MSESKILVLGLNPAWQKTVKFDSFSAGQVNRAVSVIEFPSGKGMNFSRALLNNGGEPLLLQPLGGMTGKAFFDQASAVSGVELSATFIEATTRTCTTCIDPDGNATEIIEPSPHLTESESKKLLELIAVKLKEVDAVAVCGTTPPGLDVSALADVLAAFKGDILIDNWQQAESLLSKNVGSILKVNREELVKISGEEQVSMAINALKLKYKALKVVAITDAGAPSWYFQDEKLFKVTLRDKWPLVNPIGAGDTVSAIFLQNLTKKKSGLSSFIESLAAGRASCMTEIPGKYEKVTAEEIVTAFTVEEAGL